MLPSYERCSAPDVIGIYRVARFALHLSWWALAGCSAEHAEVGSDWPPTPDAADSGSGDRASAPSDGAKEGAAEGGVGRCDALAPLRLYYRNLTASSPSTNINYIVKVENATGAALPLGGLEVRYYFTNELAPPWETEIFYTDTCCSNKMTDFNDAIVKTVQSMPARPNADSHIAIGFAGSLGTLAPGDAVQVELGFHAPGYSLNLTQTNDYSYAAAAAGTQTQWNACPGPQCDPKFTTCSLTVYRDGALVWGTPP